MANRGLSPNSIKLIASFFIGIILIILLFTAVFLLKFNTAQLILTLLILILIYAIILFFLLDNETSRIRNNVQQVSFPQPLAIPTHKDIIEEIKVSKPEIKTSKVKYDFIGSTKNRVFHQRDCNLVKLIPRKARISDNSKEFFIRNKFKPCKKCLK